MCYAWIVSRRNDTATVLRTITVPYRLIYTASANFFKSFLFSFALGVAAMSLRPRWRKELTDTWNRFAGGRTQRGAMSPVLPKGCEGESVVVNIGEHVSNLCFIVSTIIRLLLEGMYIYIVFLMSKFFKQKIFINLQM